MEGRVGESGPGVKLLDNCSLFRDCDRMSMVGTYQVDGCDGYRETPKERLYGRSAFSAVCTRNSMRALIFIFHAHLGAASTAGLDKR